ncbi:MAG: LTA synthase family protein [Oscillospiraceae bacterium]|nr:LTA synthase family protein [Oscillospiraceae bacterium]
MEAVEPAPEPPPEPLSHLPAPLPINTRRLKQELKKGEQSLAHREKDDTQTPEDLPWLPPPDGAGPSAPKEKPDLLRQLGAALLDALRVGAAKLGAWTWTQIKRGFAFLIALLASLVANIRQHLPPLPAFLKKKRKYRGRLRVRARSQWSAFAILSVLTGLAVTASVEAVRTGGLMEMCAWAAERMGSFFLSALLYASLAALIGSVFGRLWLSGLLVSVFGLVAALVNYFKLRIDGTPLVLSDFGLIGQAGDIASVAGELNPPEVFWRAVWFLTFWVMTLFFLQDMTRTKGFDRFAPILASVALTFCLFSAGLTGAVGGLFHVEVADRLPPMTNHRLYGLTVSLWRELFLQKISPPDNYGPEQMREVLNEIDALSLPTNEPPQASETETETEGENPDASPEVMPNVIVILSESFFDATRLAGVTYDRDPVENFHDLQSESISGRFYSHYLGYGTGYIEMSMQTGIGELDLDAGTNICFMPDETYNLLDSLAEQYVNRGDYTAEMLHAYDDSLYNRTVTYPLMGYSKSLFSKEIRDLGLEWNGNLYGGYYMKDSYFFTAVLHEMRAINETGNKAFLYGITMENHQPFNPDKFNGVSQVKVTAPKLKRSELEILKVGIEGIVRADAALRELTDALREYPVPTIVAFFGDHRPTLPMPNGRTVYAQLGMVPGGDTSLWTTEQIGDLYSSDYLIWANDAALLRGQAGTRKSVGVLSFGPTILELTGQPVSRWWKLACLAANVQLVSREVYFANGAGEVFFTQAQAGLSEAEEHLLYLRSSALYDAIYGKRYITSELNRAGP